MLRRSSLALAVVLAATACNRGTGVDLTISAPGTESVELFVAPHSCAASGQDACDSAVAWDSVSIKRPGSIFILDSDSATTLAKHGSHYNLELHAEPGAEPIERILAVGYQNGAPVAAGAIMNAAIPSGDLEVWDLALAPIAAIPPGDPDPTDSTPRLHVWSRKDPSLAKCVVGEQLQGNTVVRELLLPAADTDCDDVAAPECDPFFYRDPGTPTACVTNKLKLPTGELACRLGQQACDERVTTSVGCQPFAGPSYCIPDVACTPACADIKSCVSSKSIPYIECLASSDHNLKDCGGGVSSASVSLDALFAQAPVGTSCPRVLFANGLMPGVPPMFSQTLNDGAAKFSADGYTAPCTFSLSWGGQAATNPLIGLVDVAVTSNPVPAGNHVVLPIVVKFSGTDCTASTPMMCSLQNANVIATDSMIACVR